MSALGHKRTCAVQKVMSALPRKRTCAVQLGMSAKGKKRTLYRSLNDHVGTGEYRRRNCEIDRFG
jgi:hypothetical protein